jgi:hypothetical protein
MEIVLVSYPSRLRRLSHSGGAWSESETLPPLDLAFFKQDIFLILEFFRTINTWLVPLLVSASAVLSIPLNLVSLFIHTMHVVVQDE